MRCARLLRGRDAVGARKAEVTGRKNTSAAAAENRMLFSLSLLFRPGGIPAFLYIPQGGETASGLWL